MSHEVSSCTRSSLSLWLRSSLQLLKMGMGGGAFLVLTTSCSLPPSQPSSSLPLLAFRPIPISVAKDGTLIISQVNANPLRPALVFPPHSTVMGFVVRPIHNSYPALELEVASGLKFQETINFYRQYYAKAKGRWLGKKDSMYDFIIYPDHLPQRERMIFLISGTFDPNDPEITALAPTQKEKLRPEIWVIVPLLAGPSMIDQNTGHPMKVFYVPWMPLQSD
jgi:hypothetical protein